MEEIWVDIEGFEDKYQISDRGNIKSLKYNNTNQEKIMMPQINRRGYRRVNLWKDNKAHQFLVYVLVAKHFLKKENKNDVPIHIGDKLDDSVENLLYVSRIEARRKDYNITDKLHNKKYKLDRNAYKQLLNTAEKNEITSHRLHERIYRGWELEDAATIPINRKEKILYKPLYNFYGKYMSIKQLSKLSNITSKTINKRLNRGWSVEEAVEIPIGIRKWKK